MNRQFASCALSFRRTYATKGNLPGGKWPRPKPGTSERPPYYAPDPLVNNPKAAVTTLPEDDLTFIHRPPPTAPSPLSLTTDPVSPLLRPSTPPTSSPLPPFIRPSADKEVPQRASDEDVAEIRRLRLLNPSKYSRGVLAKMFGTSQNFVGQIAAVKKTKRKALIKSRDEEHELVREKWSDKKSIVRAIRVRRKEFW